MNEGTIIYPKYKIGDIVYLKTDELQRQRIITGYILRPNLIIYYVSYLSDESFHYDFELSETINFNLQ